MRNILTWTFTSDEDRERAETRIRSFAACEIRQEFVVARLQNPGVEDVQISINTVSCGDFSEDKPTLGTLGLEHATGKFRVFDELFILQLCFSLDCINIQQRGNTLPLVMRMYCVAQLFATG